MISLVSMVILDPKIVINFPEPIRRFAEKKNHIGFISLLFYKIGECGVMTMGFYIYTVVIICSSDEFIM